MKKNANLPALIFLFVLLVIWQAGAMGMNAAYILPSPTQILVRMWELCGPLLTAHLPATLLCTGIGLAISIVLGLLLAVLMDASPTAEKTLYPLIVASQTIPTTALAPLFVLWFGYTIWSKVLVTVLITFFPIAITVFDGFRSAKTDMVDMLKTFGAGKKEIFLKLTSEDVQEDAPEDQSAQAQDAPEEPAAKEEDQSAMEYVIDESELDPNGPGDDGKKHEGNEVIGG